LLKKVGFGKAKSRILLVSFFRGTAENYNIAEEEEHSGPGRFALSKLLPGPDFFLPQRRYFLTKSRLLPVAFTYLADMRIFVFGREQQLKNLKKT